MHTKEQSKAWKTGAKQKSPPVTPEQARRELGFGMVREKRQLQDR